MWQSVLRNWVWGAVTSAAKNAAQGSGGSTRAAQPCDVGVVFALKEESGCFADRLSSATTIRGHGFVARDGLLGERRVVIIETGAGQSAASKATDALIVAHRPRLVISAGFAGGLRDGIETGHIVMPDSVQNDSGERLAIDLRIDRTQQASLHVGPLITMAKVIRTSSGKRALHQRTGAIAVDMETLAVARMCQQFNTPFLAVRIISDSVSEELPKEVRCLSTKENLRRANGCCIWCGYTQTRKHQRYVEA